MSWLMIVYKAPAKPSSARVSAWRRLHKLGAMYTGPSACLLPQALVRSHEIEAVAAVLRRSGGTFESYSIESFSAESEHELVARFNAERDAEYAEVIERAQALIAELKRETALGKLIYAEVEENEDSLSNLRKWLARVRLRDVYGAAGRTEAESAVESARKSLEAFVASAVERSGSASARQQGRRRRRPQVGTS
jgi:hypothetical protein